MIKKICLGLLAALFLVSCSSEPKTEEGYLKNTSALYKTGAKCFVMHIDRWMGMWQYKDPKKELENIAKKWKKLNCDLVLKAGEKLLLKREAYFKKELKKATKLRNKCVKLKDKLYKDMIKAKDHKKAEEKSYKNLRKAILNDPKTMLDCTAVGVKFFN